MLCFAAGRGTGVRAAKFAWHQQDPQTADDRWRSKRRIKRSPSSALRCTVARRCLRESLREFSCHLAESPVLQQFCLLGDLAAVTVPGHSQLQRYAYWLPAEEMRAVSRRC